MYFRLALRLRLSAAFLAGAFAIASPSFASPIRSWQPAGHPIRQGHPAMGPLPQAWVPQPIHTIINRKYAYLGDLIIDAQGRLYAAAVSTDVYVYNDPVNEWQAPNEDLVKKRGEVDIWSPIALGEDDRDLYMETEVPYPRGRGGADHVKRSLTVDKPDSLSFGTACGESDELGLEYSMAVNRNYVLFTCEFSWTLRLPESTRTPAAR
jgi:hypothetical protein